MSRAVAAPLPHRRRTGAGLKPRARALMPSLNNKATITVKHCQRKCKDVCCLFYILKYRIMLTLTKKNKVLLMFLIYKWRQKQIHRRKRQFWVHPVLACREDKGEFYMLFEEIRNYEEKFSEYLRMSVKTFDTLLNILQSKLQHQDTIMRRSISAAERLVVTLRYLATGNSMADLEYRFRIGKKTISLIIREVCVYIWSELAPIYLKMPSERDWLQIAKDFEDNANFPHCLGAIDGKHIRLIKPHKSGSMFLNYKHFFSIVLMAVVDTKYNFIFIDVGAYGKDCDSNVFKGTRFWNGVINNTIDLPRPQTLPNTNFDLPYVFVADEAFALHCNLLRPFSGQQLDAMKSVFNYRLTRARRYVECAFGIMTKKWQILNRPLNVSLNLAVDIVKTCCVLQNFIHKYGNDTISTSYSEICTLQRSSSLQGVRNESANVVRNKFAEYFMTEQGRVSWQNNYS